MDSTFVGDPITVPPRTLTRIDLRATNLEPAGVSVEAGDLIFSGALTQRELILRVSWDDTSIDGHRFAHTKCGDGAPLHSEAIEARVLNALTAGDQVLRGTTWTGPGGVERSTVEVWHDASLTLRAEAAVTVRTPS